MYSVLLTARISNANACSRPSVKRIVYTTSTATMVRPTTTPLVFDESNWNDAAVEVVKTQGRDAPGYLKYFASKVLAEKGAQSLPFQGL